MKTHTFLVKNSGKNKLSLILEPLAHIFDIAPGLTIEVNIEQQPDSEAIEIEYVESEIVIYCGGMATARSNGVEIKPRFLD
jgi:hypothetical protein